MIAEEIVVRDKYGFWMHSALKELFGDKPSIDGAELYEWCDSKGLTYGIEYSGKYSDDDYGRASRFNPVSPGIEWFIGCITDADKSEIICVWLKQKEQGE